MSWLLKVTVAVVTVKLTSHPELHNWPIKMRGEEVRSGIMTTIRGANAIGDGGMRFAGVTRRRR